MEAQPNQFSIRELLMATAFFGLVTGSFIAVPVAIRLAFVVGIVGLPVSALCAIAFDRRWSTTMVAVCLFLVVYATMYGIFRQLD